MSIQGKFTKFNSTISITHYSDDYKAVKEKDESIKKELYSAFKEAGYPIDSDFRQGSFATDTAIRSLDGDFDLDRGLIILEADAPDDPVKCKKTLRDTLAKRGFKSPSIKTPCVTADYTSLDLHIDYPVYCQSQYGQLKLGVGKEFSSDPGRFWQDGDPKGLISWVKGDGQYTLSSEAKLQYRRIIRYLKRWRDFTTNSESTRRHIYSIGLAVMVKQSYASRFDDGKPNDLESMHETVKSILNAGYFRLQYGASDKYDVEVRLPTSPYRDIFEKHGTTVGTTFRTKLKYLERKLQEARDESDLKKQCDILRKVFGDDFPEHTDGDDGVKKAVHVSAGTVPDHGGA